MTEVRQRKLRWVERGRVSAPKGTMPWPCQARTLCHCLRCLLCQHALCPGPLQRGHMGGCHASASITIRGWSMQGLPIVTAPTTVSSCNSCSVALYLPCRCTAIEISFSFAVIPSSINLHNRTYAPIKLFIFDRNSPEFNVLPQNAVHF